MPSLPELVRDHTDLGHDDIAWLGLLQADWQIIADLSFADLVLWVPDREGTGYWAIGQMRPTTGPTALVDDIVGTFAPKGRRPLLDSALHEGRIAREGDPEWRDDVPVRVEAIPVRRDGRIIALVARNTNLHGVRTPSRLELSYLQTASELTQMIAHGTFPYAGQRSDHADSPRVGDGFVRVDAGGTVTYASPNAMSVYRKLGLTTDLAGEHLAEVTRALVPPAQRPDEESISAVLGGRMPRDTEIGNKQGTVIVRSIPLRPTGDHTGALILLRDVTDLRRRDRELVTKDATIREIHHRVKNNLQTVAALLRLQARRIESVRGREALEEAVRRVGAIAVVHETLSQTYEEEVEFDAVADQLLALVREVGTEGGAAATVALRRTGSFGTIGSDVATPLAMILTEVLQNAMEHAFPDGGSGRVDVAVSAGESGLVVRVTDDGVGLPDGFDPATSASLGLSIVRTLIGELGGSLRIDRRDDGDGTVVELTLP
ncbi:MAG TPA: histidine kinase N-terminal domain-containing protein [Marmoricola sp.]|nr:histidine kinase N-terminal domain-containing protein [Marmoricola sp.]